LRALRRPTYTSTVRLPFPLDPRALVAVLLLTLAGIPSLGCQTNPNAATATKERRINGKLVIKYVSLPSETGSRLPRRGALLEDGSIVALDGSGLGQVDKVWLEQAKGRF
jgi:hypothetical protein